MFNPIAFLQGLFGHKSSTFAPSQSVVDEAGTVIDGIEAALDKLQALAPNMPEPYKGLVAGVAVAVHNIDTFVDQFETKPGSVIGNQGTPPSPTVVTPAAAVHPST